MFRIVLLSLVLLFPNLSYAAACAADKPGVATVKVNGLVCDFCARALEKVFAEQKETVSKIKVDLDGGFVRVDFLAGKTLDDATLTKLITDAGYDVKEVSRGCS